jgi:type 1 glutamine amidotransferase
LVGDPQRVRVLATAREEGMARPLFWPADHGRGRVFVSIPQHYSWSFDDPVFRAILLRGLAWATGDGVDGYDELVTLGARIAD